MATVLGLSFFYHDSAAALVADGGIVAAAAEERFTRRKHTNEFPKQALAYCLREAGLSSINDLDAIVFYEKPVRKLVRVVEGIVSNWPRTLSTFVGPFPPYLRTKVNIPRIVAQELPAYDRPLLFCEHHLSHAASAFYCSPFEEAAVLTVDGVGEWETTTMGWGKGTELRLERSIYYPHSVGLLFSALTGFLGFRVNDAEWKVMGLAPYGKPSLVEKFRQLVSTKPDGSFRLDLNYFAHQYSTQSGANEKAWARLFGFARRGEGEPIEDHHRDLARSGQQVVEELLMGMAKEAKRMHPSAPNLVIGGGVGLNSVANYKIQQAGIFEDVWIQPAAGDDGGALGAAVAAAVLRFGVGRPAPMEHVYLGPEYSRDDVALCLDQAGITASPLPEVELLETVAGLLAEGKVIGWYDGRMEFGPRSLGARSILASPLNEEMKERVNRSIKFREPFRPFAPVTLQERVHEFFEVPEGASLPFMIKVATVREDQRKRIPAVTHVDGTGRVQTVAKGDNPRLYRLIELFGEKTGTPVLLNTSFNVRGEPIVCTPKDALDCFARTDMDALILGDFLIQQKTGEKLAPAEGSARSDQLEAGRYDVEKPATTVASGSSQGESVKERVLDFYKLLPFNDYSSAVDFAKSLIRENRIEEYPPLHNHLKAADAPLKVMDVGSGAGWFVNSCSYFYKHEVAGLELNPVAVGHARDVARVMGNGARFSTGDLFQFPTPEPVDVINSLGVLHHTDDCLGAVRRVAGWIRPGGFMHLGLYHTYGRKPFLDHFAERRERGDTEAQLLEEFTALFPAKPDETHLLSWFRDQVLHPHETQHTYEEIHGVLKECGLEIQVTSINHYRPITSHESIFELEKRLVDDGLKALAKRRYFPGFFVIWARKVAASGDGQGADQS